jgi:transposase
VDRSYLEEQLAAGMSLEQIAEELGLHASTVGYWLKKHQLEAVGAGRFAPRGAPDRTLLDQLAADGATLKEMADAVERSISTVRYWLDRWDIERPRRTRRADPAVDPVIVDRECRRHGLTRFRLEGRGYYRCLLCRQERVSEWRRRVKRRLIEEAGGKCMLCGYAECAAALQFHHVDPSQKTFALSHEGVARNMQLARAEAAKCILLCANCHAEVEVGYRTLPAALTMSL